MRHRHPVAPFAIFLTLALCVAGCAPLPPAAAAPGAADPTAASPPPASHPPASPPPASPPSASAVLVWPPPLAVSEPPAPDSTAVAPNPSPSSAQPPAAPPSPDPPPAPAATDQPTADARVVRALQRALGDARESAGIPGISVTILFADGTAWTGVSGHADIAAKEPVTPDTAFSIASISKTFLAALALELSAEGAFGLDDPAAPYLPELDLDPAITVRMLLDHTSGLHDYFLNPKIDPALQGEPSVGWGPPRTLAYVSKPYFAPGTGWQYSNTNYLLLGLLVERVSGRSAAELIRERFLDPLALERSWYQSAEKPRGPIAHGYRLRGAGAETRAIDLWDGSGIVPFRSVVTAAAGAGSLAASSPDLARWARALYGGEAIDPANLSTMLAGVERVTGYRPRVPYGLGVQVTAIDGHRALGHSGRFLGSRAVMRWLPDEEIAIAVLTNQSRADPGAIAARLISILLPDPLPVPAWQPF